MQNKTRFCSIGYYRRTVLELCFFMFDNCFNILLHSKVLNKFTYSFLNSVLLFLMCLVF